MPASKTPICDFVNSYAESQTTRFHMPGHKGRALLGYEPFDITEIKGADALYEADGIIAQSEAIATELFGSGRTLFSTEGSSQCIRAMLYLCSTMEQSGENPLIVAARNVHKAFVYAAALLDFEVKWLFPQGDSRSLCSCIISPQLLEETLSSLPRKPVAVYVTCPDYLGGLCDIKALAEVCHRHGTLLAVDNAHGAYLHFLENSLHPLDLGTDICCDSAHKTLPVLTGGAYLQISRHAPAHFAEQAKQALELFGSTSPSYLIMQSLDRCNGYLSDGYREKLTETCRRLAEVRAELRESGWKIEETDPLRITVHAPDGLSGVELAEQLRQHGIECEYADPEFLVLMATPENNEEDFRRLLSALGSNSRPYSAKTPLPMAKAESALSIRRALFSPHESIPSRDALGRICAAPAVSCPPAIPIAVPGELIGETALQLCRYYGFDSVEVVK